MQALPLAGLRLRAGSWPAAALAGRLLASLGASVESDVAGVIAGSGEVDSALSTVDAIVWAVPSNENDDWLASGLGELTGRPDGPPQVAVGRPATVARATGLALQLLSGVEIDTVARLAERARLLGLHRNGSTSAGGGTRLWPAADGWFALNLARESDIELLPALLHGPVSDPWDAVSRWAAALPVRQVVSAASELGLAVARLGEADGAPGHPGWQITAAAGSRRAPGSQPLVVNLAALWAGPLCAQLLARTGACVVDVESTARPDRTPATFRQSLREGHELRRLDFGSAAGRAELGNLIGSADVVIEASRPRALRALGVDAESIRASGGEPGVWVRISGHGRSRNRIAFGDDAAVAGGLIATDADGPMFAGDAIADPLTGTLAALAASACLRSPGCWTVEVAMAQIARFASESPPVPESDTDVSVLSS